MSSQNQENFDDESQRRNYTKPHSGNHPIPTIQGYREHKRELKDQTEQAQESQEGPEDESRPKRAFNSVKQIFKGEDKPQNPHDPYPATNRNYVEPPPDQSEGGSEAVDGQGVDIRQVDGQHPGNGAHQQTSPQAAQQQDQQHPESLQNQPQQQEQQGKSATEHVASATDPKEKRKLMKKTKRQAGGREVTDPVTHLPIVIHDLTDKDLSSAPENEPEPGEHHTTATGPQGASKSTDELEDERASVQRGFNGVQRLFPPPEFERLRRELAQAYENAVRAGLAVIGVVAASPFLLSAMQGRFIPAWTTVLGLGIFVAAALGIAYGMGRWLSKKVDEIVDDETWDAARRGEQAVLDSDTELPESVQWMNSLLASIWPLVNPDLFSSVIDMVEDIMQASLPKVIKMVSVDDMGQGNQSLRILGVRWLPTGAASQSVGPGGKLETPDKSKGPSDRTDPENPQQGEGMEETREKDLENGGEQGKDKDGKDEKQGQGEQEAIREGMEAEEGDFVNLELAVAYRSRASGRSIRAKAKNAHLFLKFYSVGGVALPVWVEVRGFIATLRLRLQLTPDPPFVSLCTLTFLGQPKASLACVPLSKHGLNLMDVPMISGFVQSAIDAALAEYVAPKSLTLNLKDMLMGADFKTDTAAHGVVYICIKRARGFKQGDGGINQGASDGYCTVSWGKFGKTVASTRIIPTSQEPDWHEYATILVTAEEQNAEEKLRLQLWDSDKWTADDDLGRVEVDLRELMHNPETHNKMMDREDQFTGQDPEEKVPGSLQWSVGYFSKVRITDKQLEKQTVDEDIRTTDQLRKHVADQSANKLREAGKGPDDDELHQQRVQDYAEIEDSMIISAPPLQDFPSGILSVQIHNITGLEVEKLNKQDKGDDESQGDAENETGDDMPDAYCNIFLNHKKIYRTRTKPKNSKPFFNAGTERFIRDWRTTDIIIAVRDQREREDDPLIGIVYLPLSKVFAKKSQVVDVYPLVGGIGFGRARISLVWRSVELQLPQNLSGWDYGTLEVRGAIRARQGQGAGGLSEKLLNNRLKLRTDLGKAKVYANGDGTWSLGKREDREGESAFLAVRKRYASCLLLEFRESTLGPDKSPAFAVLWLQELVDEGEAETRTLKVWKGGKDRMARAKNNVDYDGYKEGEQPIGEVEVDLKFWRGLSGYHKRFASASKTGNMREVMECLDTITDENLAKDDDGDNDGGYSDEDDTSDSNDDDNGGAGDSPVRRGSGDKEARKKLKVHTNDDSSGADSDGDGEKDNNAASSASHSRLSLRNLKKLGKAPKKVLKNPLNGTVDTAMEVIAPGHNDADDASRGLGNSLRDYKDHHRQLHRKHRGIMQWRAAREVDHVVGKVAAVKGAVGGLFRHGDKDTGVETEV